MKITIIANPHAGSGAGRQQLADLQAACHHKHIPFTTYQTTTPGQLSSLISTVITTLTTDDTLVIIGGDGTLNEAIATLKQLGSLIPVAYLPAGTGNDFARQLRLTKDATTFLSQLQFQQLRQLEFLTYTERLTGQQGVALNSLGFGLDAEICALNTNEAKTTKKSWGLGKLSYLTPIIDAFKHHKNFEATVKVNHHAVQHYDKLLLIGFFNHAYFGGGVKFVPQAIQNSHTFETVLARDVATSTILRAAPAIFRGTHFDRFPDHLIRQTSTRASIHIETPITMQTDGEVYHLKSAQVEAELATYPMWMTQQA